MAWLFADTVDGNRARLGDGELHHLQRVLRRRPGTRLAVIDGRGRRGEGVWDGSAELALDRVEALPAPRCELILALGARETVEEGLRRAAELGVARVHFVMSRHSRDAGARPDRLRLDRLQQIARSACAQSGNPWLPELLSPRAWADLRDELPVAELRVLEPGRAPLGGCRPAPRWLAIGPEGGWAEDEIAGVPQASIAPHVLRAHVAVAVALGILADREAEEAWTCAA